MPPKAPPELWIRCRAWAWLPSFKKPPAENSTQLSYRLRAAFEKLLRRQRRGRDRGWRIGVRSGHGRAMAPTANATARSHRCFSLLMAFVISSAFGFHVRTAAKGSRVSRGPPRGSPPTSKCPAGRAGCGPIPNQQPAAAHLLEMAFHAKICVTRGQQFGVHRTVGRVADGASLPNRLVLEDGTGPAARHDSECRCRFPKATPCRRRCGWNPCAENDSRCSSFFPRSPDDGSAG